MNHRNPAPGNRRWDGSRHGQRTQRLLRLAPDTRTRALRAPQSKACIHCGNRVEWYPRADGRPVPLHPHELPAERVPPRLRWHINEGIAHPISDGTPWCRIPHTPLCPATEVPAARLGRLAPLRRRLALITRCLTDQGHFTPAALEEATEPSGPERAVVLLLATLYLAPAPLDEIRCVAQTRARTRCTHHLLLDQQATRIALPVPPAPDGRHLACHLTGAWMLVHELTLPYIDQLRWRQQHCPTHHGSRAPDVALAEWEPFDAFAHHQHISLVPQPPGTLHGD